jgi:hypothetical protein
MPPADTISPMTLIIDALLIPAAFLRRILVCPAGKKQQN